MRFVLVGGTAVILHGVPRTTADLDLVLDLEASNVQRFVEVMTRPGRMLDAVDAMIDSPIALAGLADGAEILAAQGPSSADSAAGPVAPGPASATPLLLAELNIKSGAVQPAIGDLERLLASRGPPIAAAAPKPFRHRTRRRGRWRSQVTPRTSKSTSQERGIDAARPLRVLVSSGSSAVEGQGGWCRRAHPFGELHLEHRAIVSL